jgi:hypothetical protein
MIKTIKAIAIAFIGFIAWVFLIYLGVSFYKAELNPFIWSYGARGFLLLISSFYICFAPVIIGEIKGAL